MAAIHSDKLRVREEIVSVAEALFLSRGYRDVSLNEVAGRSGLYPATVRLYFPDKEALYLGVVLRGMRVLNAMYEESTETESVATEKLRALGETLIEFSRRYPDYYRLLYNGGPARLSRPGDEASTILDIHDRNLGLLYSAVEACVQGAPACTQGELRCDLGLQQLAVYLIALSIGIFDSDPFWRPALEAGGVDYDRFARNLNIATY